MRRQVKIQMPREAPTAARHQSSQQRVRGVERVSSRGGGKSKEEKARELDRHLASAGCLAFAGCRQRSLLCRANRCRQGERVEAGVIGWVYEAPKLLCVFQLIFICVCFHPNAGALCLLEDAAL